jgi:hypothetical protein
MRRRTYLLPTLYLAWSSPSLADDSKKPGDLSQYRLDLSVPDIPAFTELGVSPSTISRPDNFKDLATALSTGVSPTGGIQSGLAVEVSPMKLLANAGVGRPGSVAWLAGLRASAATNAVGASAATQNNTQYFVVLAGRYAYSTYQPETDSQLGDCLGAALLRKLTATAPEPPPPPVEGAPVVSQGTTVTTDKPALVDIPDIGACRAIFRAAHLVPDFAFEAAYAHAEVALNSASFSDLHPDMDTAWASITFNVHRSFGEQDVARELVHESGNWTKLLDALKAKASGAYAIAPIFFARLDGTRISPATSSDREENVYVAARLPVASDGWSVFVEGGHKFVDIAKKSPTPQKDTTPAGVGFDLRLANGTWLGLYASADLQSGTVLSLANLKWSFGEASRPF